MLAGLTREELEAVGGREESRQLWPGRGRTTVRSGKRF
jgi:hypothetical protein